MTVTYKVSENILWFVLDGEIDEHSVKDARYSVDDVIDKKTNVGTVVFNLSRVSFMDSTGIGFLIGRYKKLKKMGVGVYITQPNFSTDKILSLAGIYSLIPKINTKGEQKAL